MKIAYSRSFKKMFKKQPVKIQEVFFERIEIFINNPNNPILRVHSLHGEWASCKSINITGDIRVVYEEISDDTVELIAIGSHSELYS